MFDSVLIANRGEIAVRIIRTLRALGIRSVAVHSDADRDAPHVHAADLAVRLPRGYLDIEGVVEAALRSGAQAVHPGYGFLAENAAFARRVADAGLVFVGPPPAAIEAMGDKIRARDTVAAAGVPVVPGLVPGEGPLDAARLEAIGLPALIKPSAGGGGKGMVLVRSAEEFPGALESARRTALAAFGDGTLLVERFVDGPRHIEIQVMADAHGNTVHLGERECSLQRRHQKIIEEAPSPLLDPETRERMGAAAVEAARSVGYVGAGTVEFIVPGSAGGAEFFFMEMNTRLQVEHPVTELVTGLDLVELQLRIAAGEPLAFGQGDVRLRGHAVEARVYAEDPARDFLPTGGRVLALREPAGVRVDSGLAEGMVVGSDYDPMLSKIVAWAPDRAGALRALDAALAETAILGVTTNVGFLRALLAHPDVVAGRLDTGLVERHLGDLAGDGVVPDEVLAAAALVLHHREPSDDPWDVGDGWRLGERAWTDHRYAKVRGSVGDAEIEVNGRSLSGRLELDAGEAVVTIDGITRRYATASDRGVVWLAEGGRAWPFPRHEPGDPADRPGGARGGDGVVRSPMPGTVLVVKAAEGDQVAAGQPLLVVEAMKMEHTVTAPADGVLTELRARTGQTVELDAVLAKVTPCE
ncbi:acetyl/propionyl-CoA carboxylase subuit alpha [Planotetraspora thailandica]|uniref:Biotin-dependent 3-methylcrotonyl-coenzyme A carboxylase alpha1 subunit n=1 Tax=Planotetraspora thailandica TaxID=487172 RepID=A0A8J3V346_9ACTN|nr:biotin carboxylase N-terminal domain-containing protein [Planotetraspora thailandica]GII54672.1 acetyl/propionyl-CoA carboxylase subuit alpha [Planotetraspora thailandica]